MKPQEFRAWADDTRHCVRQNFEWNCFGISTGEMTTVERALEGAGGTAERFLDGGAETRVVNLRVDCVR